MHLQIQEYALKIWLKLSLKICVLKKKKKLDKTRDKKISIFIRICLMCRYTNH